MQYLLPCQCGQKLTVDVSQAGLRVRCTCGAEPQVPTLRGLATLERADESAAGSRASSGGPKQAVAFFGLAMITVAATATAVLWFTYPKPPEFPQEALDEYLSSLNLQQLFEYSDKIRQGQPMYETPEIATFAQQSVDYAARATVYDRYLLGMAITAGLGVLLLLISRVMRGSTAVRPG